MPCLRWHRLREFRLILGPANRADDRLTNDALLNRMIDSLRDGTTKEIQAVRLELRRFQNQKRDAAVQFYCIAVDQNLAAALDGSNDPSFREILASNVENLAAAIRSAHLDGPVEEQS